MFSPAVITSRAAQKHHDTIVSHHSDLLQGMAVQADKVAMYNQQRAVEKQNEQVMQNEVKKEEMVQKTAQGKDMFQAQKDAMTFAQKQAELDIKRAALSATD